MYRALPARPNLEHLKKQAKTLLQQLQAQDRSAQLADAQHALAREYGFASWPKLAAHVERESVTITPHPFAGRWVVNVARSQPHPDNPFTSAAVEFAVAGSHVTITDVVVDDRGREERHVNAIVVDGAEHVSANGYALRAMWRGPRVLETVASKDGQAVGSGRYEVSADGTTLTVLADRMWIVFDRADVVTA